MQHLNQIYIYNLSLKNQILNEMIGVVVASNRKNTHLCKPNNQFEILTPKELNALIEKYTKKCFQYYSLDEEREKIKGILKVANSFDELQYLIYSLYYSNLIELKNKENFKDLEKLYTSGFLIDYSTKINVKDRGKHAFNLEEYKSFYDEMCEGFIKGIAPPSLTDGTLDYSSLRVDLMGLNKLFWKYCSINAIFEMVEQSIDLTRYLHDLVNDSKLIKNKLLRNPESQKKYHKDVVSAGGKAKNDNYNKKMNPIFDEVFNLYQNPNLATVKKWKNRTECARYFIRKFYEQHPDTDVSLNESKLVTAITERINERSASRKVTLLAER